MPEPTGVPVPLSLRLRRHIEPAHRSIEATPVARAMVEATITRAWYARLLRRLVPVHRQLESRHRRIAPASPFAPALVERADAAARDLADMAPPAAAPPDDAEAGGEEPLVDWLHRAPDAEIIGACYVVVGSLLGSRMLRPALVRALAIGGDGAGLAYHAGADAVSAAWPGIQAGLDRIGPGPAEQALAGALAMMEGLRDLHAGVARPAIPLTAQRHRRW